MIKIIKLITDYIKKLLLFIKLYFTYIWNDKTSCQYIAKEIIASYVIISILIITIQIFVGVSKDYIIFDQFDVPDKYDKIGYTSKTIINRLVTEVDNIKNNSVINQVSSNSTTMISTSSVATPTIVIPGSTLTLNSIIFYLKEAFLKPVFTVTGDIVDDINGTKLRIRLRGGSAILIKNANEIISSKDNNIDEMIKKAAENLYIQIDPLQTAGYFWLFVAVNG